MNKRMPFIKVSGASNKRFPGLRGRMAAIGFVRIALFVDRLLRFLHQPCELMQLDGVQIGYGPIVHARVGPMQYIVSLSLRSDFAGSIAWLSRPDVQIDEMLLALVDERGDSSVIEVLQPAADKRKPLTRKVLNRRSEIELAVEPWLYRVLVGRDHIGAMTFQLQRADVIGNHLLGQELISGMT